MAKTERNKEQTKQKFIDAVSKIIVRDGFKAIGINTISKEAGLDKVLIYRYFDGLDGLLHAFAKQKDFYINISEEIYKSIENASKDDVKQLVVVVLNNQLRELRSNKELQELMLWEMIERNELTIAIAKEREKKGYELSKKLKEKMNIPDAELDVDAIMSILVSGLYYLALRSRTVDVFNGVEIDTNAGWLRIESAIQTIVNNLFNSIN
ncbi:MAG: TetR/AcrR family transcriptional regulator [Bacteroidales bacterium]|nr:TetR/AcrR family transcriptional regulator [Bacteroidales bacterium]